jgi:hypothetical protein
MLSFKTQSFNSSFHEENKMNSFSTHPDECVWTQGARPLAGILVCLLMAACTNDPRSVVFVGEPAIVAQAQVLLPDHPSRLNGDPAPDDPVVFTISSPDGPTPRFPGRLEALRNKPHGTAAILLMQVRLQPDAELEAVAVLETREVLGQYEQPGWDIIPVFRDSDPNITLLLSGL